MSQRIIIPEDMQSFKKLATKHSELLLDLENGAKIVRLVLGGITVIDSSHDDHFTSSGCFLMYPWVNRVHASDKYIFKDQNGLPIHGLYANVAMEEEFFEQKENQSTIRVTAEVYDLEFPKFMETFTLTQTKLTMKFELTEPITLGPVCFGYHPYLQLGNEKLSETRFNTDITTKMALGENMLPRHPFQQTQIVISPKERYDDLFWGGSFFEIEGNTHKVRINSNLPFWQIYTPDEHRIAVQPMSYCGNMFGIFKEEVYETLKEQGTVSIEVTPR